MGDTDDINEIFRIVDSDGSGYLNKEKLQCICPYLSPSEIDIIFNDLDTDHDNRISLKEFTHGFKEVIEPRDRRNLLNDKELINYENSLDKKEDSPTNIGQIQINEVFYNLSWYENNINLNMVYQLMRLYLYRTFFDSEDFSMSIYFKIKRCIPADKC